MAAQIRLLNVFLPALTILVTAGLGFAQSQFGSVVGSVTDPTGAEVPGVVVRAVNEASNMGFSGITGGSGDFVIGGLLPGTYSITAEKTGFKDSRLTGIRVNATQASRADIKLLLGATSESVTVSAVAAALNTESGSVAQSASAQYIAMPATIMPPNQTLSDVMVPYLPGQTYIGGRAVSAYGSRTYDRRVTLDGSVFGLTSTSGTRMPRGSVEELRSSTLDSDAEHQTANSTEMITAKGSNDYHGSFWSEFQNQALNALGWYVGNIARPPGTPVFGYGFVFGGPVFIPKIYNGRDKTFFHMTFQKYHYVIPEPVQSTLPTDAMRNGDLSAQNIPLTDPLSGTPFSNQTIPSNRISPVAQNILNQYYPKIGAVPFSLTDFPIQTNYTSPWWDMFLRFDQQIGSKDSFSVSYLRNHMITSQYPNAVSGSIAGPATPGLTNSLSDFNFVNASANHIFSPNVLNEINFGIRMGPYGSTTNEKVGQEVLTGMGLPATPNAPAGITGGPTISISGLSGLSWGTQGTNDQRIYTVRDGLSWTHGKWTTKAGFELVRRSTISTSFSNLFGTYNFSGKFTGSGFGDFLLGLPSQTSRSLPPGPLGVSQQQMGFFGTESVHLTRKLVLNFGLRVEYNFVPIEPSGKYYNFDQRTGNLVVPGQSSLSLINPGLSPALLADIVTASAAGFPSRLVNGLLSVNPRIGWAYQLTSDTVIRGGYGMYGTLLASGAPTGGPFTPGVQNFTNTITCSGGLCTPAFTLANPFPGTGVNAVSGLSVSGVNPNLQSPQTHQWNVSVERRLPSSIIARVSYVGTASNHLPYQRNLNLPPASTIPLTQSRLTYPQWFSVNYADSGGTATYEGLDTELKKQWSNGLTLDAGYTLAKCLTDDDEGGLEQIYGSYGPLGPVIENPYNRSRNKGNCEAFPRHSFRTNYVWDLPFGRGRKFLRNPKGVGAGLADAVVGGWSMSGFFVTRSGHFYTPLWTGFDAANTGQTLIRPDRVCSGVAANQGQFSVFNPACFVRPQLGTYGNAGTGIIQGLGMWRYDSGFYKYFAISDNERFPKLRLSMTSMNFLNHPGKETFGTGPYVINNPTTVALANTGVYDSGSTANLGDNRMIFLEARIEW